MMRFKIDSVPDIFNMLQYPQSLNRDFAYPNTVGGWPITTARIYRYGLQEHLEMWEKKLKN